MKITELIRGILDVIDRAEGDQPSAPPEENSGYSDNDIKRFRQIVDLAQDGSTAVYANEPKEQYADLDSVTVNAGTDNITGVKDLEDIRGEHPQLYPNRIGSDR